MKLSEYCCINEKTWDDEEIENANKLINYLNSKIDKDLYEVAKTNNNLDVYKKLNIWLFNFYGEYLIDSLKQIGISFYDYQKSIIISLILSITRNSQNRDFLIQVFKNNSIIEDIEEYEEGKYKLKTISFGDIYFEKADKYFENDKDTIEYIENYGDKIVDGCHEVSLYLLKKNKEYTAVTSICTMSLNKKYYHSFIVNGDVAIDLTSNLVINKNDFYSLNSVVKLNCLNYTEYIEEKDKSLEYDESKTLFELLRIALYKQYERDNSN